jgi:hypothetical protein
MLRCCYGAGTVLLRSPRSDTAANRVKSVAVCVIHCNITVHVKPGWMNSFLSRHVMHVSHPVGFTKLPPVVSPTADRRFTMLCCQSNTLLNLVGVTKPAQCLSSTRARQTRGNATPVVHIHLYTLIYTYIRLCTLIYAYILLHALCVHIHATSHCVSHSETSPSQENTDAGALQFECPSLQTS